MDKLYPQDVQISCGFSFQHEGILWVDDRMVCLRYEGFEGEASLCVETRPI